MPGLLLELAYSRKFESQADDFAYDFLIQNDIQTEHFANIMFRLMSSSQKTPDDAELASNEQPETGDDYVTDDLCHYLASHPTTRKRIEKFQK